MWQFYWDFFRRQLHLISVNSYKYFWGSMGGSRVLQWPPKKSVNSVVLNRWTAKCGAEGQWNENLALFARPNSYSKTDNIFWFSNLEHTFSTWRLEWKFFSRRNPLFMTCVQTSKVEIWTHSNPGLSTKTEFRTYSNPSKKPEFQNCWPEIKAQIWKNLTLISSKPRFVYQNQTMNLPKP